MDPGRLGRRGHLRRELAKHLGATVAATTGTTNVALVRSLGADVVIDCKTQDFEDVLRDWPTSKPGARRERSSSG